MHLGQARGVAKAGAWKYLRVRTDRTLTSPCRPTLREHLGDITGREIISYVGGVLAKGAGGNRAPREGAGRSSGGDTAGGGDDTQLAGTRARRRRRVGPGVSSQSSTTSDTWYY